MSSMSFEIWREGSARGGAEEGEEKYKKGKIDIKVSIKFQINLSSNS
jgi:hypothetical protein